MPWGITAPDIITWALMLAGMVVFFTKTHVKVIAHEKLLYDDDGQIKVVTHGALSRRQQTCSAAHTVKEEHITTNLERVETRLNEKDVFDTERISKIGECVAVLNSKLENACG